MAERDDTWMRVILLLASLIGAAGVVAAAAVSHDGGSRNLAALSTICLSHGPALIGMALAVSRLRAMKWAACLLSSGTLLFASDLAAREWLAVSLFPGAAPLGGGLMILGWLGAAVAVLIPKKAAN